MDPLKIMLQLEHVIPYYKPIVSADSQLVIGYEVCPYFHDTDTNDEQSLDWFFSDSSIPEDFQLELTNYILEKTLDRFIEMQDSPLLFFNYNVQLLFNDNAKTLLEILQSYATRGFTYDKIVVQIKETEITEEMETIGSLLKYMNATGIQISLDDVGQRNGNLDRLVLLKPNIVKVDAGFLKEDELPHLYRDVHHALSMVSRKIGATLLFKDIRSYNQLNYAWRNGVRYYQGEYLMGDSPDLVDPTICQDRLNRDFQRFVQFERKRVQAQLTFTNQINDLFKKILPTINSDDDDYDIIVAKVGQLCDEFVFRVYITNEEGVQLSSNAEKNELGEWQLHQEGKQKNWSWRPYFFENIIRMNVEKKGILSDMYTDIMRNEQIRTYAFPLSKTLYIFLDIPYTYLYEQDGLL
ncbi:EAL domain-containing protein [Ornithinibacillus contaminans]|uniref:EAL domain-containing protein n=1 Tax=Ornithinibacillus contaminans TaxID=694055 RepID=UPI00064DCE88|nr:EAL-associated domain-containing protein [Ornithinibacillus contaminans]